ncbi:MAG: MFS transporter [Anaerolineae bacterium]
MKQPFHWCRLLALNAYSFGISFMWNALHPIVLPVMLLAFVGEEVKNTTYGLLTFGGLVVAMLVQPLSGSLSDYTSHPAGRRRPWILLGTLLDLAWLAVLASAGSLWVLAIGYMGLQLSSNLAHGAGQGLIPDLVPEGRRGIASGLKNLLDMLGIVAASVAAGRLMRGDSPHLAAPMAAIAVVLLCATTVTLVCVRESPALALQSIGNRLGSWAERAKGVFSVDLGNHGPYWRLLMARFFVLLGSYSVQSFALYYVRDALGLDEPALVVSRLMLTIGLMVTLAVFPAGLLSELWGRKRLCMAACALTAVGMASMLLARDMAALTILGGLTGVGLGTFMTANWAWATDLVPVAEAGKYLGLSNLATAGPAATARLLGPAIDLINHMAPSAGYSLLFVVAALGALAGYFLLRSIPDSRAGQPVATLAGGGGAGLLDAKHGG